MEAFQSFDLSGGLLANWSDSEYPTLVSGWRAGQIFLDEAATHYGFVQEGEISLDCRSGKFRLGEGMYFSLPGEGVLEGEGCGIVLSRLQQTGFFLVGGPIESTGRLRYIDGCTDSLLIPPVVKGDACLNLLHLPPGTRQTEHTHPSLRAGLIASGTGRCLTPTGSHNLERGMAFVIPPEGRHCFHTNEESLLVIAYHPDSDFGPENEDHPMVNRTIVEGVSAASLPQLHTR